MRLNPSQILKAFALIIAALALGGCNGRAPVGTEPFRPSPATGVDPFPVMLGIDVLEAEGFAPLLGKRVALISHPAGVNRRGERSVDVLRGAPNVNLTTVFAFEHGFNNEFPAGQRYEDYVDPRTGMQVRSLYNGRSSRPTQAQLAGIDVVVIDLQDIGVRSYTYSTLMRYAIEECFRNNVEVIVLDRPNPLGGLKVDGPLLDQQLMSGVGGFRVPYVHGLTMGELARMAYEAPGVLQIDESIRNRGRLTVIPMRGWHRSMRWPETGLTFVRTSPLIGDFAAVVGYAMVGLGSSWGSFVRPGFSHGVAGSLWFRTLTLNGRNTDALLRELQTVQVPGVAFRKITVNNAQGQLESAVYVDVTDWDAWRPTELSFHLLRLNARLNGNNPFASLNTENARSLNIHIGSTEWYEALRRDGARVNVEGYVALWQQRNAVYQEQVRRYWLYD